MNVDTLLSLFRERGDSQYGGECVTQLEHALQAAHLAESNGDSDPLVAAALLHDVGHLLHHLPDDAPDNGVDDCHEKTGGKYLRKLFPPSVTEPVRLHVPAKRYLCTTDQQYHSMLSEPSLVSLELQGGLMDETERSEFESLEFFEDALCLRRYDDLAKSVDAKTPTLDHYAEYLYRVANSTAEHDTALADETTPRADQETDATE